MVREILFKAKEIKSGKWVYGYYKKVYDMHFVDNPGSEGNFYQHIVDKNTICQYTGLTDKNGNKIWENDIVRLDEDLYIVTWEEDDAMFALEDVGIVEHFSNADSKWCEVVGNKFDNPELLKGE